MMSKTKYFTALMKMFSIMIIFVLLLSACSYFFMPINLAVPFLSLNDNIPINNNNNITATTITNSTTLTTTDSNISIIDSPQLESIFFTGGHWFAEPNMITFFIRFADNKNQLNFDLSSIKASLVLGDEKILMSGDMKVFDDHGLFTTGNLKLLGKNNFNFHL